MGVNAPGMKMSKKSRKKLNQFIEDFDGFISMKIISKDKAEFKYGNGSVKLLSF